MARSILRPSHPSIIPANSDIIGGKDSANGVLIIGEKEELFQQILTTVENH